MWPPRDNVKLVQIPEDLPDIPELESVEARNGAAPIGNLVVFTVTIGMILLMLYWMVKNSFYRAELTFEDATGVFAASAVIIFLWILPRFLWPDLVWKTDGEGLSERGIFRRRFIPWKDVKSAATSTRWGCNPCYTIYSDKTSITIPGFSGVAMGDDVNTKVIASVWQHLRRQKKAEGMVLTATMRSLWQPVPETVEQEQAPQRPWYKDRRNVIMVCLMLLWIYRAISEPTVMHIIMGSVSAVLLFSMAFETLRRS